jgi:ribosomal protein S14
MRHEKICVKCGKPFMAITTQTHCHDPCYPKSHRVKYKHNCENCGRIVRTLILPDSPEEVLCSFCIELRQKEKARQKEREETKAYMTPRKCKICGQYAFLVRYSKMCRPCFTKSQNPQILDVREVSEQ